MEYQHFFKYILLVMVDVIKADYYSSAIGNKNMQEYS